MVSGIFHYSMFVFKARTCSWNLDNLFYSRVKYYLFFWFDINISNYFVVSRILWNNIHRIFFLTSKFNIQSESITTISKNSYFKMVIVNLQFMFIFYSYKYFQFHLQLVDVTTMFYRISLHQAMIKNILL